MELKFDGISKKYNKKYALKNFSTTLDNGVYGLLGPNGAGKTTLINITIGILHQNEGEVYCDGLPTRKLKLDFISKIGYLPQHPSFYKNFRAREFLHYICAIKDIPKEISKERTEELLKMVNLSDEGEKRIGSYSGGMRQRLGIAQAMLNDPELLILDEPTAGLDPKERIRFRNIISKLSADRIVILATHIVSDVEYIAKEILLLKQGVLIAKARPKDLIEESHAKVFSMTADDDHIASLMDKLHISNIQHAHGIYTLRVIDENPPAADAVRVEPNLEDVFLYYFKGEQS